MLGRRRGAIQICSHLAGLSKCGRNDRVADQRVAEHSCELGSFSDYDRFCDARLAKGGDRRWSVSTGRETCEDGDIKSCPQVRCGPGSQVRTEKFELLALGGRK